MLEHIRDSGDAIGPVDGTTVEGAQHDLSARICTILARETPQTVEAALHRTILEHLAAHMKDTSATVKVVTEQEEILIGRGQKSDLVYILLEGTGTVQRGVGKVPIGPGTLLGEISAVSGGYPTANVWLNQGARYLAIPTEDFQKMYQEKSDASSQGQEETRTFRDALEELMEGRLDEILRFDDPDGERQQKEFIRTVRTENILGMNLGLSRDFLERGGLRAAINEVLGPETKISVLDKYKIVFAVSRLLLQGLQEADMIHIVTSCKAKKTEELIQTLQQKAMEGEGQGSKEEEDAHAELPNIPALRDDKKRENFYRTVRSLLLLYRKLASHIDQTKATESPQPYTTLQEAVSALAQEAAHTGQDPIDVVDHAYTETITFGLRYGTKELKDLLWRMGFQDFHRVRLAEVFAQENTTHAAIQQQELPESDPVHIRLSKIQDGLRGGDVSAVGGNQYLLAACPEPIVQRLMEDPNFSAVVYDGSDEEGLRFSAMKFGYDPRENLLQGCAIDLVRGMNGQSPARLIRFPNGNHVLLFCGRGASRQVHFGGALLSYQATDGTMLQTKKVVLARSTDNAYPAKVQEEVTHAIKNPISTGKEEKAIPGITDEEIAFLRTNGIETTEQFDALETQIVILQNPQLLASFLGKENAFMRHVPEATFGFSIAYAPIGGTLRRLLIPKVGGPGVYGDTAGEFLKGAARALKGKNLLRNVLFMGTAGVYRTAGMPPGLGNAVMPRNVIDPTGKSFPVNAILDTVDKEHLGPFTETEKHLVEPAPVCELVQDQLRWKQDGVNSVDLEGIPLAEAIASLKEEGIDLDLTVMYEQSDEPATEGSLELLQGLTHDLVIRYLNGDASVLLNEQQEKAVEIMLEQLAFSAAFFQAQTLDEKRRILFGMLRTFMEKSVG